jgi:hypothetical protein
MFTPFCCGAFFLSLTKALDIFAPTTDNWANVILGQKFFLIFIAAGVYIPVL